MSVREPCRPSSVLPGSRPRSAPGRHLPPFERPGEAVSNTQGSLLHPALVNAPSVQPVSALTARFRGRRSCGIWFDHLEKGGLLGFPPRVRVSARGPRACGCLHNGGLSASDGRFLLRLLAQTHAHRPHQARWPGPACSILPDPESSIAHRLPERNPGIDLARLQMVVPADAAEVALGHAWIESPGHSRSRG